MAGNQELFQALKMFGDGMKSYGLSTSINEANQRSQDIKKQIMPDMEKRQALSSLANDVTMQLAAGGADSSAMAAVHSAIAPPSASTADQAILMGNLNGDRGLMEAGMAVRKEQDLRSMNEWAQKFKMQEMAQDRQDARTEKRAARAPKVLDSATLNEITSVQTTSAQLNGLLSQINKFKGKIGAQNRIPGLNAVKQYIDPEYAAFTADLGTYFDSYRHAVTGAGAGPGELDMLMKNVPNISDSPASLESKIKASLKAGQRTLQIKLQTLGRAGRDVGGFTDLMIPNGVHETPASDLHNYLED